MSAKILVVEDELIVAEDIKVTLLKFGFEIVGIASSAKEAVNVALQTKPDLIIMDIVLEGDSNGIEAAHEIRKTLDIPVIFLTAYSDMRTISAAKKIGPFGYIVKPFKERELYSAVEIALYKHRMEEKLKRSQQWYSTTLQSVGDGVIATNEHGNVVFMNPVAEELTGWYRKDALGKQASDVFRISDKEQNLGFSDPVEKTLGEGKIVKLPARTKIITKTGKEVAIGDSVAPIKDHKGNVHGSVVVFQDFTELENMEVYLKESEQTLTRQIIKRKNELLKTISVLKKEIEQHKKAEQKLRYLSSTLEQTADYIMVTDKNGIIEYVNPSFEKNTFFKKEEVLGRKSNILKSGKHDERFYKNMWGTILSGNVFQSVLVNQKKNGEFYYEEKTITPVRDKEGKICHFISTGKDITRRREIETKLARAERLEMAGRIAGQIAHDFNNLLMPLTAYPALLVKEFTSDSESFQMLQEMQKAAEQIAEINQQLLTLGRRAYYSISLIDLNKLLHEVVSTAKLPKSIGITKKFQKDLFLIKGGNAQLTRAFLNLLNNAAEAIKKTGKVLITTQNVYLDNPLWGYEKVSRGEYVKVEIKDSGCGIEPDVFDKIFDPFFTTKITDPEHGSGLGLSIVRSIVQDHNGYITVDSKVDEGTTFTLYFPTSRDDVADFMPEEIAIKGGHESVLIVDDDPLQRNVSGKILTKLGYRVSTVESGESAVEFVKSHPQDLLIIDMLMEGIDGTETYRRILDINPQQKAILVSGYAFSKRVKVALRMGAGAFVNKPFTLRSLALAVRKELDKERKS